ncbi:MAG: hypothetical protein QG589_519 [Patescibacteria group bacterium]|nr:hypothetical protein [Patescibacteria group bacterium]
MKIIHKYLIAVVFVLCLLIPIFTRAATVDELQAVINSLLAQIQSLQVQLAQVKNATTGATSGISRPGCYVFSTNFGYGSSGQKVADLQAVLEKEGFTINNQEKDKDVFLASTQSAVSKFQEKYRDDILVPTGLERPNGFIGRVSRLKLNEIYGCDQSTSTPVQVSPTNPVTVVPPVNPVNPIMPVACTMEAKLCPDGKTYVGRTGPRCEFSACPTTTPKCDTGLLYMPSCNGVPVQNPNTCEITCSNSTNPPLPATTTPPFSSNPTNPQLPTTTPPFSANPVPLACTNVMKLCPDGKTFVGATGPQCSFAPCPAPTTKFFMVCDYAAPPAGCSYVAGPSFDPASQCGMVLSCSSTAGSKTKEMCPKYMCAAPPAGFHYAPDPSNVCSCGILSPGNELQ